MTFPLKSFYFLRHGETDWNINSLIMGQTDIPLNKRGISQAYEAQRILQNIEFDAVYTSPLIRALRTAEIVCENSNLSLVKLDGLREHGWGKYEGRDSEELSTLKNTEGGRETNSGAETNDEFEHRILNTLEKILNESDVPLIVAHGGVFGVIIDHLGILYGAAENALPYLISPSGDGQNWDITVV